MRRGVLAAILVTLAAATPAAGARTVTCPGPGCAPVGSFSVRIPASGKIVFYEVVFTGKAAKPPVVSLSITGSPPTGNVGIAAVEPKAKVKNGVATVTILLGVSNVTLRKIQSAGGGTETFEGFAPSGTFSPEGYPSATPTPPAKFDGDYSNLSMLGYSWSEYWFSESFPSKESAKNILANQIKASYK